MMNLDPKSLFQYGQRVSVIDSDKSYVIINKTFTILKKFKLSPLEENRNSVLELQYYVDSEERDLFFDCPKSMSLKEMFKGWKIRDKQRTSSAVWNTPPRYSEYIRRYN